MPDDPKFTPLDLDRFSETLRRRLYDRVAQIQFSPPDSTPTPDEAGLQIVWAWGRWLALWMDPEEPPTVPASLRFHVVRIGVSHENPADIELNAV